MYGSLMGSSLPSKDDSLWLWLAAIFFGLWHVRRSAMQIDTNGHQNLHCAVALLCFDGRVLWYNVVRKDAKGWMRLDRGVAGASFVCSRVVRHCLFVCLFVCSLRAQCSTGLAKWRYAHVYMHPPAHFILTAYG